MEQVLRFPMKPNFDFESFRIEYDSLPKKRTIAGGAQGTVIESELQGQKVAVKVMSGAADWHRIATALQMKHEYIVATLKFCEIPYCLVMELCKCSLYDRIHSRHQITRDEFRNWSIQIATGMEYLHSNRITHRDLKSLKKYDKPPNFSLAHSNGNKIFPEDDEEPQVENKLYKNPDKFFCELATLHTFEQKHICILLNAKDTAKLCDFDQARTIEASDLKMQTKTGTRLWAAPESLRGEEYTKSVDVWGFAVVIWELVTQLFPYHGADVGFEFIIHLIAKCEYRLNYPTGLPQCLRVLMMSCLNSDPTKRPKFSKILDVLKRIAFDKEFWNYMKPYWKTTKYDYSYKKEDQQNFDDARAIADKKAERIRQYFEEFLRNGRNLVENEKSEVRELTEAIRIHNNFMVKFAIGNFVENEPLIENLRPMIEEGERLLDKLRERKNGIIVKKKSENSASCILTSLTNQINHVNSVDLNALIQGTDFLFILLQRITTDSRVCEQAFEIIAKAIRTTNEKLTQNCCDLLKLPKMEVEIMKRKVPTAEILLETLKRHLGEKNIATSSIFLLGDLICEMNKEETNKMNDKGLIELTLKYLDDNSSLRIADSQLVYDCWRILANATATNNAKYAERFVKADGFSCFRRYQRLYSDDVDILWRMVSTIYQISRHTNLRSHFFNDGSIPLLISLLNVHVDCVYLSCQTAWTLAHLLNEKDSLCSKAGMNELAIKRKITQTILSWDILVDLRVGWNSLSPLIDGLSQSENLSYQLLSVWTLANLVLTKSAQYRPLLIKENGLPPLQRLLDDLKTNENVRFYARIAYEKLKKWQQISISK